MATPQIGVRLPEELRLTLQSMADSEHRTLSNLIILVLSKFVESSQENSNQATKSIKSNRLQRH